MKTQYRSGQVAATGESQYREVRGLSRGLAVLRALNAQPGGIGTVVDLARATGLHRTTVKRLLETLRVEDLVHQKDEGGSYALGYGVRRLAEGYIGADWIDNIATPLMRTHLRSLRWPSDLATPDDGFMIVRESTQRMSMLSQLRATIGIRLPMFHSSLGRAWLSYCSYEERAATLAHLAQRDDAIGAMARDATAVRKIVKETRRRGYAINRGELSNYASVMAIACPIMAKGQTIGAINLVLPRDLVSEREIATRYAPLLRKLAGEISTATALL